MLFMEASAQDKINVEESFSKLVEGMSIEIDTKY